MIPATIAVVIPNYNYAKYLSIAIDSVLNQIAPFDEIIVVDDGSTDNSRDVIGGYGNKITAISIPNGGQLGAIRAGVLAATSEYIYTMDADDFAGPGLVAAVKNSLADRRPVKVQFQLSGVDGDGNSLSTVFPTFPNDYDRAAMLHDNVSHGFYISPPTSGNVFSREALTRLGFDAFESTGVIDNSPSLAMPYLGEIVSLNEPLAHYRVHSNSMSSHPRPTVPLLRKEIAVFQGMWREVATAVGTPFPSRPLFIVERQLMIVCMENQWFIAPEVWRYTSGLWRTKTIAKQRILLTVWAISLLLPSPAWRDHAIRLKRSAINRAPRLRRLINLLART